MLFIALAIVHIRNKTDWKIPVLSALQGIEYEILLHCQSALQIKSVFMFFRPKCPKPTQSGGSLGLSFIPLNVSKVSNQLGISTQSTVRHRGTNQPGSPRTEGFPARLSMQEPGQPKNTGTVVHQRTGP